MAVPKPVMLKYYKSTMPSYNSLLRMCLPDLLWTFPSIESTIEYSIYDPSKLHVMKLMQVISYFHDLIKRTQ